MDKSSTNVNVIIPEGLGEPKYSNTFRTSFTDVDFHIDFGYQVPGEEQLSVVSRVAIPTTIIQRLVFTLFTTAQEYERSFNKDLGFGGIDEQEK